MSERGKVEGIVLIYEPVEEYLNQREIGAYRNHREQFIKWLATQGKNPEALEGYAKDTFATYANLICTFHRNVWENEDRFTLELTHDQAEDYLRGLIISNDYSSSVLPPLSDILGIIATWEEAVCV